MPFFELETNMDFDSQFLVNVDLDVMEQTVVDDILSDLPVTMTMEEITQLQEDGLLDLSDHSSLPCKLGIEATDMGSLLEQFEEASQTLDDCDFLEPTLSLDSAQQVVDPVPESNESIQKKELTTAMIQKIKKLRAAKKQKTTVMLPMVVPAKRGRGRAMTRGHPVGLPATCTPRRLQRVMEQNEVLKDSLSLVEASVSETASSVRRKEKEKKEAINVSVAEGFYKVISDHDYPKNAGSSGDKEGGTEFDDIEEGELIEDDDVEIRVPENFKKDRSKGDRNYRKRGESPEIEDETNYFDKLPSYYTALSIPRKQIKKTASCVTGRGGISVHDYIERDRSPERDTSMYNKVPDYCSSFTNSTKYDTLSVETPKGLHDSKNSSGYSSLNHSPARGSRSHSRSSSRSVSGSRKSRSRSSCRPSHKHSSQRQSSYSPYSRASGSRSCSTCSDSSSRSSSCSSSSSCSTCDSRSPSRSPERAWQRERDLRGERSQARNRSRSSKSRSKSIRRNRARHNRSRGRSRSYSSCSSRGYRSRSRSRSFTRVKAAPRNSSIERRREERKKEREAEKKQQMRERRIVYVGGIPNHYTRHQLKDKFSRFGEIDHVQLHFREHGDNYGFVTFVYTCDAYAAIEKGKMVPGLEKFDLCFGGRRQFCDVEYADLDGNKEIEEEYEAKPRNQNVMDFDEMLRLARQSIKKS